MPDDDKIAAIMQESGRYAARAMEYLPPGTADGGQEGAANASREQAKVVDALKVHFLFPNLTDRELEVFQLIGDGVSRQEIAERLGLDVNTVETYRSRIKEKLRLKDANELLKFAIRSNRSGNSPV